MASCSRAHAINAVLVAGFLLILLNLLGSRWDSAPIGLPRMGTTQWPKRTRTSSDRFVQVHAPHQNRSIDSKNISSNDNGSHQRELHANHDSIYNNQSAPRQPNKSLNNNDIPVNQLSKSQKFNESQPTTAGNSSSSSNDTNPSLSSKNSTSISDYSENLVEVVSSKEQVANSSGKKIVPEAQRQQQPNETIQTDGSGGGGNGTRLIDSLVRKLAGNSCPPIPPNLDGPVEVDATFETLSSVEQKLATKLLPGGHYIPRECTAHDRVAVIVPYRDREQHLPVFLKNLHPFLMKQQIEYGIYIVEQAAGSQFNRASLMNVGFAEAMKQKNWDCMVFHDVDLLPMDDRNLYTCPDQPRHMSVAVDTFGFKLPYSTIFGGVSAMTAKQFRTVNGFSNSFWGWGGEDDDMSNRLKHVGFHIARYPINIARYTMLSHKKEKANPKRYEKLVTGAKRFDSDGLNSLHYKLINLIRKPLFTWVHVEISQENS
ncbi:AAEL012002-PA [Aedes aegypti]|uniref:Beta-1,4-N-acetylgalactosaminyltransferase n=1 Tax=Aedes aegypti TaxID=7159 RepID=Q16ND4_AEDAE|nr:AAEL012002-PA [Aedes aegypti]